MAPKNSTEVDASEYDMIPYVCTDGYDTIEDVGEKHDTLVIKFPPRHGPLPSSGYSGLLPDEPKPPGVYSRMYHKENSIDNGESDVDGNVVSYVLDISKPDLSSVSDFEETTMKTTMRANSYLDLTTQDFAAENEAIPSAYLKISDDSLQYNTDNNVIETLQKEDCSINPQRSPYLKLIPDNDKDNDVL